MQRFRKGIKKIKEPLLSHSQADAAPLLLKPGLLVACSTKWLPFKFLTQ